jgi:molybdopterin synthase catalytic subunit
MADSCVKVRVLFFAKSREVSGVSQQDVELPVGAADTATLLETLVQAHPGLASVLKSCVLAVNQEYVEQQEVQPLRHGDEVAVIPPLSGG